MNYIPQVSNMAKYQPILDKGLGWSIPKEVLLLRLGATKELDLIQHHYSDLHSTYTSKVQHIKGRQPVVMTLEEYWCHVPVQDRSFARWDNERSLVMMVTLQYPLVFFHEDVGGPALYKRHNVTLYSEHPPAPDSRRLGPQPGDWPATVSRPRKSRTPRRPRQPQQPLQTLLDELLDLIKEAESL